MADEQDHAEDVDTDKVEGLEYPPEHPIGVDDPTQDDRVTDTFSDRAAREEPEVSAEEAALQIEPEAP